MYMYICMYVCNDLDQGKLEQSLIHTLACTLTQKHTYT